MESFIKYLLPRIVYLVKILSAVLLFTMMALTFIDVLGRYLFNAPIYGSAEMIQFLLALTIFSALGIVNADDSHIVVEVFEERIKKFIPNLHGYLIQGFSVLAMAFISWQLYIFAEDSYHLGSMTTVLEWPLIIVTGSVAFLSILSLICLICGLFVKNLYKKAESSKTSSGSN